MQRVIISGAFAALAYTAAAGVAARGADDIKFVDQTWDEVCEGSDWTIKWSKGNGKTTSVKVKGDKDWSETIGEAKACPGEYEWTVKVPECDKEYTIELKQEECESLESPKFYVACAGDEEWEDSDDSESKEWEDDSDSYDYSKEWSDNGSVTVVYYDESCTCTKTKETPAPTHNKAVWYDSDLKCSVTAEGPAPTGHWADAADPADAKKWGDAADPVADAKKWGDAADPVADAKKWGDAAAPTDAAKTWGDAAAPSSDPAKTWGDAAAPVADAKTWADAAAPAAATPAAGSSWADSPVAPLESKPAVAAYTGAAAQLTGSFSALAAVFLAALAL